jgi:Zn-dependent protease with chaperone function
MSERSSLRTARSPLDLFGREAKQAWIRIAFTWQVLVMLVTLGLFMPEILTTPHADYSLTTSSNQGSNWVVYVVAGLLIARLCLVFFQVIVRKWKVKNYIQSGSKENAMLRPEFEAQVEWLENKGIDVDIMAVEDTSPDVVFFNSRQQDWMIRSLGPGVTSVALTSGLLSIGLTPEELRSVVIDGAARTALPWMISGPTAKMMFSLAAAYVGVRVALTTANPAPYRGAWFMLGYGALTVLLQFLFVRWATLIGNNICLLADAMTVKLTGDAKALAIALRKIGAALSGEPGPPKVPADSLVVPPETGRSLAPLPWNFPTARAVGALLRRAETLGQARADSLHSIATGHWLALGDKAPVSGDRVAMEKSPPSTVERVRRKIAPTARLSGPGGAARCGNCGAEKSADAEFCTLCLAPFKGAAVDR